MTTGRRKVWRRAALLFASAAVPLTLAAQDPATAPAQASTPALHTVALTTSGCVEVAQGDIVTFEWNPAFENPGAVTGLHDFTLTFLRADQDGIDLRLGHGLKLQARPPRVQGKAGADTPVTALPNGFYELRFRVHLDHVAPGQYRLAAAFAEPEVAADYTGSMPRMTNTPTRSPFCLNVSAPARPH